jgi:hypothetical protein
MFKRLVELFQPVKLDWVPKRFYDLKCYERKFLRRPPVIDSVKCCTMSRVCKMEFPCVYLNKKKIRKPQPYKHKKPRGFGTR